MKMSMLLDRGVDHRIGLSSVASTRQ